MINYINNNVNTEIITLDNVSENVRKIYYDENKNYFISKFDNSLNKNEMKLVNFAFGNINVSNYYNVFNVYNYIKFLISVIFIYTLITLIKRKNNDKINSSNISI